MPRIRSIKPEFFLDEDLARLAPLDRLIFVGLWCQADRCGRLEDRPGRLKVQVCPYDDVDMKAALDRLVAAGFLVRYEAEARSYLQVRTFLRHQRPHSTEQPSVLPALENGVRTVLAPLSNGSPTVQEHPGMEEGKEEEEGKGKEEEETPSESCRRKPTTPLPPMVSMWNEKVAGTPLKAVRVWSSKRDRVLKARLRDEADLAVWGRAMDHLIASDFHRGVNDQGWVAGLDFLLQPGQAPKWLDLAHGGPPVKADDGITPQLRRLMGGA